MLKGTILDSSFSGYSNSSKKSFDNEHDYVRKAISETYKGFMMVKTHEFNEEAYGLYGIYKARVEMDTLGNDKCIVAIVPGDKTPLGGNKPLSVLKWTSFQTRESYDPVKDYNNFQMYPQRVYYTENPVLKDKIRLVKTTKVKSIYKAENVPLKVELLHLNEDDSFPQNGSVWGALQVYSTVLVLE
jgi:hypothetical protein